MLPSLLKLELLVLHHQIARNFKEGCRDTHTSRGQNIVPSRSQTLCEVLTHNYIRGDGVGEEFQGFSSQTSTHSLGQPFPSKGGLSSMRQPGFDATQRATKQGTAGEGTH